MSNYVTITVCLTDPGGVTLGAKMSPPGYIFAFADDLGT